MDWAVRVGATRSNVINAVADFHGSVIFVSYSGSFEESHEIGRTLL